jgi:hypothetical protein
MTIELPSARFKASPSRGREIARHLSPIHRDGCLDRGALLHALRPAAAHLTIKPSRGGQLVKVSYVSRTTTLWCIWCDSCYVREAI